MGEALCIIHDIPPFCTPHQGCLKSTGIDTDGVAISLAERSLSSRSAQPLKVRGAGVVDAQLRAAALQVVAAAHDD